jgi:hypothetical protein
LWACRLGFSWSSGGTIFICFCLSCGFSVNHNMVFVNVVSIKIVGRARIVVIVLNFLQTSLAIGFRVHSPGLAGKVYGYLVFLFISTGEFFVDAQPFAAAQDRHCWPVGRLFQA